MPVTHIQYSTGSDFNTFLGYKRVFGGTLRLAFNDMSQVPGLNIPDTSKLFHYRFGTLQSYLNTPDDGRTAVPVTPSGTQIVFKEDGIAPSGYLTENPYIECPGFSTDYQYIYEIDANTAVPVPPAPVGVTASFVMGAWTDITSLKPFRVLMGSSFKQDPGVYDPNMSGVVWTHMYVGRTSIQSIDGLTNKTVLSLFMSTHGVTSNQFYGDVQITTSGWASTQFLLVHTFFSKTNTDKKWFARFYVNGLFVGETSVLLDNNYKWYAYSPDQYIQLANSTTLKPAILGLKQSAAPWSGADYGTPELEFPWPDTVDEVLAAKCWPILDGQGNPVTDVAWQQYQAIFPATRHPNPGLLGVDSPKFITMSPVVDTAQSTGYGVQQVKINRTLVSPTTGQQVSFSVRASDTLFAPGDTIVPWSQWVTVTDPLNNTQIDLVLRGIVNGSVGAGRYVQVRIRILPSSDSICTASPTISDVELYIGYVNYIDTSFDLPGQITVYPYNDLPGIIFVHQSLYKDLPGKITTQYGIAPVDLPGIIYVIMDVDLPGQITVVNVGDLSLYKDLPGTITIEAVVGPGDFIQDLPATITISTFFFTLPGLIYVRQAINLPATITVTGLMLPGKILVRQTISVDLPGKITVSLEAPGSVAPIVSNVQEGVLQSNPVVSFTWQHGSFISYPITGYYYSLQDAYGVQADISWSFSDVSNKSYDFTSLGSQDKYFSVAAVNTLGVIGPTSYFHVMYNNPPGTPGTGLMAVDGKDTLLHTPLVASRSPYTHYSWTPSTDFDPGDVVTYTIQWASRFDFGPDPLSGLSSIVKSVDTVPNAYYNLTPALNPGVWYWRIQASDGKSYSAWSQVGSFQYNAPPSRPVNLDSKKAT